MAPLRVAVIGGGPGAMFFCHSLNQQRQNQQVKVDLEVTCFERRSTPGGVWRSGDDNETYNELWTNGPCYNLEFHDYTFEDHFGKTSLPVYLPRKDMTEYLHERVTKKSPTFFEDYFQFDTEVFKVEEDKESNEGEFRVTLRDCLTGEMSTRFFDRCIWAVGENSKGKIPAPVLALFSNVNESKGQSTREDDASGVKKYCVLHSTETKKIQESVKGRRVLLVGGGFSAEDLALQCLKWGADHVDVTVRNVEAEVTWMSRWPGDRVKVHKAMAIQSVDRNTITLGSVKFMWPYNYEPGYEPMFDDDSHDRDSDTEDKIRTKTLSNIETVIFCTGYEACLDMLDEPLRPDCGTIPAWFMGIQPSTSLSEPEFDWENWKMDTNNMAHQYVGDVQVAKRRMARFNYNSPDMHHGILFKNPNMMILCEHGSDVPLLSLDVNAWLLCSYLTGKLEMPSVEELKAANRQQVLDQMNVPFIRYFMDEGYFDALNGADEFWPDAYGEAMCDYEKYMFRLFAKLMQEARYPGISIGTYKKLNKNGKAMVAFGLCSYYMRNDMEDDIQAGADSWSTFRDNTDEPKRIYSLYTGTTSRPLKKRWMDINGGGCSVRNGDI